MKCLILLAIKGNTRIWITVVLGTLLIKKELFSHLHKSILSTRQVIVDILNKGDTIA